jgi:hypothetical protein
MNFLPLFFQNRPILIIFILAAVFSFPLYLLTHVKNHRLQIVIFSTFLVLAFVYFGPLSAIFLTIFLLATLSLSQRLSSSPIVVFFLIIQAYIILGLVFSPLISLYSLLLFCLIYLLIKPPHLSYSFLRHLNLIDCFFLLTIIILGSFPQTHYDAIHANLYTAKWYINLNSFSPLPEATSSLFPQNSIFYYSFFYALGQEKALQIALLIPAFVLLFWIKKLSFRSFIPYLLLLTPIVFFESTNGYYDLFTACLTLSGLLFLLENKPLSSASLIGMAAATKFFPLIFFPLPLFFAIKKKNITTSVFCLLLLILPLSLNLYRTYSATGSPVFPFYQQYFSTPKLWSPSDHLEQNPTIQTTMNTLTWIKGGYLSYPFLSFFHTSEFLESPPYFPTFIPILFLPLLGLSLYLVLFKKNLTPQIKLLFLSSLFGYFFIGLLTRYYRYLWPYQFILFVFCLLIIKRCFSFSRRFLLCLNLLSLILLLFNLRYSQIYFQIFSPTLTQIFQPNFYQINHTSRDPISALNQYANFNHNITILDSSSNPLGRFHRSGRSYFCNWYWYTWPLDSLQPDLIKKFDYIITSNPPSDNNICQPLVKQNLPTSRLIYENKEYQIYQTSWSK